MGAANGNLNDAVDDTRRVPPLHHELARVHPILGHHIKQLVQGQRRKPVPQCALALGHKRHRVKQGRWPPVLCAPRGGLGPLWRSGWRAERVGQSAGKLRVPFGCISDGFGEVQ